MSSLDTSAATLRVVHSFLQALDCPRSLSIWLLFSYGEHQQLVDFECTPADYNCPQAFRDAYAATKFLSKADFLSLNIDKKQEALKKFYASEDACAKINDRGFSYRIIESAIGGNLHDAICRKIESLLGDISGEELFEACGWGPGVTTLIKGNDTSATNKFRLENGITQLLYDLVGDLFAVAYPNWTVDFSVQAGNKVITVPKNSKIDRTIAVEPGINLWFQKGAGTMIRRRLLRAGVDLNSQDRNQRLARLSSKTGHLATIDFSSASDTIARKTVEALLPPQWFVLLNSMRSHRGRIDDGYWFTYAKFSSMGNGFTFELESLIFYAIAYACVKQAGGDVTQISVFGDDVIIPVDVVEVYSKVCEFYGFTVNKQKSFSSGYFRESCGSHYYSGTSCKPVFLRRLLRRDIDFYLIHNNIRRFSHHTVGIFSYCEKRFRRICNELSSTLPLKRRYRISEGYGDGGFISNFDEACPSKVRSQIEGFRALSLVSRPKGYEADDHAILLARLRYCNSDQSYGNTVDLRGKVVYFRKKIYVRQWYLLGPWL